MLDEKRIKEAEANIKKYLEEGLLTKSKNETAKAMYIENSDISLENAKKLSDLETENYKPHLWVVVSSYYSTFYISNAVLLHLGYKVGDKISHKVTSDALIALVRNKLRKELLEEYEDTKDDALDIISYKVDNLIKSFEFEKEKRSKFQYQMDEKIKKNKALTSLERAKSFTFEMKKLLK